MPFTRNDPSHERRTYLFEPVDVLAALREAASQLQHLAQRRQVRILCHHGETGPAVQVMAHRTAFMVLLKCLLRNAIEHSPPDALVSCMSYEFGFTIRDYGPGIAPEQFHQLFKWHWRGAHKQDGIGLGLAIAQSIVQEHDWHLHAINAEPGAIFFVALGAS